MTLTIIFCILFVIFLLSLGQKLGVITSPTPRAVLTMEYHWFKYNGIY